MTIKSVKQKLVFSLDSRLMPSDGKRTVVSVAKLRHSSRRSTEQIRRAMEEGSFAELKPGQAGF